MNLEHAFKAHPVRAKSISWIELFYPCGHSQPVAILSTLRGIRHNGKRPIAFKWHNPGGCKVTTELVNWVYTEFTHIFNKDAFKWQASSYTAPKELQWHLLGLTNNS